eukprot:jgi/Galph1/1992/GphlegSOOS_G676.1
MQVLSTFSRGPIRSLIRQYYSLEWKEHAINNTKRYVSSNSSSQKPSKTVPKAPEPPRRVSLNDLKKWKASGRKIVMVTAYDYPSAVHADLAEVDVVLVGDSVAMVSLGHDTTQQRPLIVGDMPFGSYEISPEIAMQNAYRLVKEGHVGCIKLEGGRKLANTVYRIVQGGIAVMGHIGLTPASVSAIGGFRSFGKNYEEAKDILEDALALEEAGAFAIVVECVPEIVAKHITELINIPTIGIGAGKYTCGQVLVYHDMCGMLQHPHHAKVTPKFCKKYAQVGYAIQEALETYRDEVRNGDFPSEQYSPYEIPEEEYIKFKEQVQIIGNARRNKHAKEKKNKEESFALYGKQYLNILLSYRPAFVLTREPWKDEQLRRLLEKKNIKTVSVPCVKQETTEALDDFVQSLQSEVDGSLHYVIVTSTEAARLVADSCKRIGRFPPYFYLAAVGMSTARQLKPLLKDGETNSFIFIPSKATGEALAEELPALAPQTVVYYPTSLLAANVVEKRLTERGFFVKRWNIYTTVATQWTEEQRQVAEEAQVVAFGSPSAVRIWTERVSKKRIGVCIGETTAKTCQELGFESVVFAKQPGLEGWANAVEEALQQVVA